jgi:photosystem II stability/assembly factor-like uncharacterized protein
MKLSKKNLARALSGAVGAAALLATPAQGAVQVSQSGWLWGNPTPQGNTIRAIDFDGGRGYAIGDAGTALRTDDGGRTWTGLATGTARNLSRVQVVTPEVLVVLGGDGCVVRRSDDGGRTFRRLFVLNEADCPQPVQAASFVDPQNGYLLLRDGQVLRTDNGGRTFTRRTAIPGTQQSSTGGNAVPADAMFTEPNVGVVFLAGGNAAFRTTDGGQTWTRLETVDPGAVQRLRRVDATTGYAVGPNTLLRTTDGGLTWKRRPAGDGFDLTSISCATADLCLMTTARGDRIVRTEDGGETPAPFVAESRPLFAAGFATPTRAVAAGVGGATVTSDDGGKTYASVGGDSDGSFPFGLRLGPTPDIAFALGTRGQIARTDDGGTSWRAVDVTTAADMMDVSFASGEDGWALDQRGGLFRTLDGGQSWAPQEPGTTTPPRAVITAGDAVLLAGPRGIRRGVGQEFRQVDSRPARLAEVSRFDAAGTAIFAYGTYTAVRTTDRGVTWSALRLPGTTVKVRGRAQRRTFPVQDLEMTSATAGYVLDQSGRVWTTADGGKVWREAPGVGTSAGLALAFGSATGGYLTLRGYPAEPGASYVLRTGDGGRTWRPQRIATGAFPGTEGVISPTATRSFALTSTPAAGENVFRSLFFTDTGGDQGEPSQLALATSRSTITKKQLRRIGGLVSVRGTLAGAQGGEQIVVSARSAGATTWQSRVVTAGANGGSFTATFPISRSTTFVAQWAGDSGRQGAGSKILGVRVR